MGLLQYELSIATLLSFVFFVLLPFALLYKFVLKRFILARKAAALDKHFQITNKDVGKHFKIVGKKIAPGLEDIPLLVKEMRASYDAGLSRPMKKRFEQLKSLKKFFIENHDGLVKALQADLGRPLWEAEYYDYLLPISEIDHALSHLSEWMLPEKKGFSLLTFPSSNYIYKEPLGLVLVIGTWNYPVMLALVPVIGAIAAGNTVILKPCNISKHCADFLSVNLPKYLDPTICSLVGMDIDGDRTTTAELLKERFDHIFFTGSPSVGKVIMKGAANYLTPVTLELGGKNPVLVDKHCDLDLAAKRIVWGRMMNCGQQCIAPDYVLIHKDVCDKFLKLAKKWVETLYFNNKSNAKDNGDFGRIVGEKQMTRIIDEVLKSHGGELIHGGNYSIKDRYIEPTILKVGLSSPAMKEETFGPILLVTEVDSIDAAISYVNSREKPLSMYIFTKSKKLQEKIVYNTSAGGVTVNGTLFHVAHPELPFGGVGNSGIGRYHGKETFNTFVHEKPVLFKSNWKDGGLLSDPFFIYPPWNNMKMKLLHALAKVS